MGIASVKAQAAFVAAPTRVPVPAQTKEPDFTKAQGSAQRADPANQPKAPPPLAESKARPEPIVKSAPKRAGTRLSVDAETKQIIASIVDETNQEIRQIPPEALLKIAARTRRMTATLFDENG